MPFLSDRLNPIFARELRSGLLGKFEYLFRLSYIVTILSQLGMLGILTAGLLDSRFLLLDFEGLFLFWARCHLCLLLIFATWFGSRAIAPEREGQTLVQLFTIPLPAEDIIKGKLQAVLTFTLYVWVLGVPPALLLAFMGLLSWPALLQFVAVEAVLAVLAAAWGVHWSFHGVSVRRALTGSLLGTGLLLGAHTLVYPFWSILRTLQLVSDDSGANFLVKLFPMTMLLPMGTHRPLYTTLTGAGTADTGDLLLIPAMLLVYGGIAVLLLLMTVHSFRRYSQSV